jgi:hypothetical protein
MKFIPINLKKLHNEEWFDLFITFRKLILKYGIQILLVTDLMGLLNPLLNKADRLLLILRKSALTEDLKNIDKERNALFRGLFEGVKALRSLPPGNEKKAAAEQLFILLSGYKNNILEGSYSEESGAIYNLLQDLHGTYAAPISLLALTPWVDLLDDAEQRFQTVYAERTQENVSKPKEHLKVVRAEADTLYRGILDRIYTQLLGSGLGGDVLVDPEDLKTGIYDDDMPEEQKGNVPYNFTIEWNEMLKKYHALLAARAARGKKDEEDEFPDEEEDDDDDPLENGPVED